jgi:FixJ family two-component response regulator
VIEDLRSKGWDVIEHASTFHLLADLSDCILGHRPWQAVGLIVVEDSSPGCRGTTIASGLRELGASIPVIVIDTRARSRVTEARASPVMGNASASS